MHTGQPFDLTKTRMQTAAPGVYSSTMDVVRKTYAKDGLTGYVKQDCSSKATR